MGEYRRSNLFIYIVSSDVLERIEAFINVLNLYVVMPNLISVVFLS